MSKQNRLAIDTSLWHNLEFVFLALTIVLVLIVFSFYFDASVFGKFGFGEELTAEETPESLIQPQTQSEISYVYANGQRIVSVSGSEIKYYHSDYLGSSRIITDETGTKISSSDSYPFGSTLREEGQADKYTFTGKEQDKTGLQYFGARYYDSDTGRFTQIDPLGPGYAYAANNPMKFVDLDGNIEILASIKNNWKAALTTAALGTITYNALGGKGFSEMSYQRQAALFVSSGWVTMRAAEATKNTIGIRTGQIKPFTQGFIDLESPASYEDVAPYISQIKSDDVSKRLTEIAQEGRFFMPEGLTSLYFDSDNPGSAGITFGFVPDGYAGLLGGEYAAPNDAVVVFKPSGDIVEQFIKEHPEAAETIKNQIELQILLSIAHEGKHTTQGTGRYWLNQFFGFYYHSSFNLIEEPARDFANDVLIDKIDNE